MGNEKKILPQMTELGLTIHELLRYGYGGFLAYLVAAIIWPVYTEKVIAALGTTISVIAAFAIGGVLYIGYRPIIGEIFNIIHELIHWITNRKGYQPTCRTWLLVNRYKVNFWVAPEAFRAIRDSDAFNEEKRKQFHTQHSELHALHITFIVLSIGAILLHVLQPALSSTFKVLLGLALFALISGRLGEILLCRQECKSVLKIDHEEIRKILLKGEFISETTDTKNKSK